MSAVPVAGAAPLLSAQWFRVATLRPQLDAQAQVLRRIVRGQVWRIVTSADGARSVRLDALAWSAVGRCDGRLTLARLWEAVLAERGDDVPTQDELIALLARLHGAGLMSFDRAPDFGVRPTDAPARAARTGRGDGGRSWRWSLGCPDAWLDGVARRLGGGLFSPWAFGVWLLLVLVAAVTGWLHRDELVAAGAAAAQSPRLLALAAMVYPVVKALHELGHGLVLRHHGGRVAEWGVAWLTVVPAPYVDASSAALLAGRGGRAAVSAAGLMVELGLASLALPVVLATQPGGLHDLAVVVLGVGGLSTLLVNGNPLLRFDGYHLLCDLADLPNLGPRSTRWWLQGLRHRLLGVPSDETPVVPAPGERPWLWGYAPAALAMRWSVAAGVVLWLASVSAVLGAAALGVFGWVLVLRPGLMLARWLGGLALADGERRRALARVLLLGAGVVGVTAVVPLPDATRVQGVVWRPDEALLRVPTAGFVEAVLVQDGEAVRAGQPLLRLRAPELLAELARLDGRVEAAQADHFQALGQEPARAVAAEHALQAAQAERADAARRLDQLLVRAPADGRVRLVGAADLPGRHLARGALLGHLDSGAPGLVRVAIAQAQAARVVGHRGPVEVRLAGGAGEPVLAGHIVGAPSGGAARLPAATLGEQGGGPFALDPADPEGLRPLQPVLLADVQLDVPVGDRIGARAHVRLVHGHAPLVWQAMRALQQQFLHQVHPSQ